MVAGAAVQCQPDLCGAEDMQQGRGVGHVQGRGQLQHLQDPWTARDKGKHLGLLRGRAARAAFGPAPGEVPGGE